MFNEPWEPEKEFNTLDVGGNINHTLSEHIVVDQKTQNNLKNIVHKLLPGNEVSNLKTSLNKKSRLELYLLTFVLGQKQNKKSRTFLFTTHWPQTKLTQELTVPARIPKEKLEITKECQDAIKNVSRNKKIVTESLPYEFISRCTISNYKLIILNRNKQNRKTKLYKRLNSTWSSKIEKKWSDIVNEKLTQIECPDIKPSKTIEFQYLDVPQIRDYIIPLTGRIPIIEYNKGNISSPTWNITEQPTYPVELFYNLERLLFDDSFHDLEFYLIRIKNYKADHHKTKDNSFGNKRIWKLEKQLLKSIDWNPFKKMNEKDRWCFSNLENIKQVTVQIPLDAISFNYLNFSSIDLIDVQNKKFNSYQFGLNMIDPTIPLQNLEDSSFHDITNSRLSIGFYDKSTTTETINSSLVPEKRSLLDPTILTIIQAKKLKKSLSNSSFNKNSKIQDSLTFGVNKNLELSISESTQNSFGPSIVQHFTLVPPPLSIAIKPKTVIINSSKLLVNHSILFKLDSSQNCNLIERKVSLMCDFIISSECCITRVKLENFQQCDENGQLCYSSSFRQLTQYFKKIVVLVEYKEVTEQTDVDLFWKIGLFLNLEQFQIHFITKTEEPKSYDILILSYILKYINKLSPSSELNLSDRIGHNDFELLCQLTNNPLLSFEILNQQTLLQFFKNVQLSETRNQLPITRLLTEWQWMSLKNLFSVTW